MMAVDLWDVTQGAFWILVLVNTIVLVALVRQVGIVLLRVGQVVAPRSGEGPRQGDILRIPELSSSRRAEDAGVEMVEVGTLRRRLLVFVSTDCGVCRELVPAANAVARGYRDRFDVILVAQGSPLAVSTWSAEAKSRVPIVPVADDLLQSYGIPGTPFACIVNHADAVLASGWVNHIEHLEALIRTCPRETPSVSVSEDATDGIRPAVTIDLALANKEEN